MKNQWEYYKVYNDDIPDCEVHCDVSCDVGEPVESFCRRTAQLLPREVLRYFMNISQAVIIRAESKEGVVLGGAHHKVENPPSPSGSCGHFFLDFPGTKK